MKRILLAGAVLFAAVGQSFAADLPPANPPPPPRAPATYVPVVSPVYNWTGIYIGINGGYGFGNSTWSNGPVSTENFTTSGGLVGGTLGANFQSGQFVFGIEADADWSGISGSSSTTGCASLGLVSGATPITGCQTSDSWLGTVRGRFGVAWDRVLFFGTAGGAFGDVKATTNIGTDTNTEFGWTAGGGVEVGITENISAKVEYLYVSLPSAGCSASCGNVSTGVTFNENLVRAGLNFRFGGF